ncbi:MAG: hypothetical protein ACJ8F1_03655 [Polyangia bacterium]
MRPLVLWVAATAAACSVDWPLAQSQDAAVLCDRIPPLAAGAVIDGQLEPGLVLYSWTGAPARFSLAYRPDGLYFFASVEDATRDPAPADALAYCGDGVELFVDDDGVIAHPPGYDVPGTMQLVIAAPADGVTTVHRGQRFVFSGASTDSTDLGPWSSGNFVAVPTATGYAVEALVTATDLDVDAWAPASGGKMGWDVSLNIGGPESPGTDACTTRSQQLHFRLAAAGACTAPYCNASALCTPTLGAP